MARNLVARLRITAPGSTSPESTLAAVWKGLGLDGVEDFDSSRLRHRVLGFDVELDPSEGRLTLDSVDPVGAPVSLDAHLASVLRHRGLEVRLEGPSEPGRPGLRVFLRGGPDEDAMARRVGAAIDLPLRRTPTDDEFAVRRDQDRYVGRALGLQVSFRRFVGMNDGDVRYYCLVGSPRRAYPGSEGPPIRLDDHAIALLRDAGLPHAIDRAAWVAEQESRA